MKIDFLETSAKEVTNVETLFKKMAENILTRITHGPGEEDNSRGGTNLRQGTREPTQKQSGCC